MTTNIRELTQIFLCCWIIMADLNSCLVVEDKSHRHTSANAATKAEVKPLPAARRPKLQGGLNSTKPRVLKEKPKGGKVKKAVNLQRWPWAVTLQGSHTCTGSLLNNQWILTAAHCVSSGTKTMLQADKAEDVKIRLGDIDSQATVWQWIKHYAGKAFRRDEWLIFQEKAEKVIIHPKYRGKVTNWNHDIALVKLKERVSQTAVRVLRIRAARLPNPAWGNMWPRDGQRCIVKGWGCTAEGGTVKNYARRAQLPKTSDAECRRLYPKIRIDVQMCAGSRRLGKGTCNGDSGGPLVCKYRNQLVQAGVTSHGIISRGVTPDVYTRVSAYIPWIRETLRKN